MFNIKKKGKKGFSLIELIVVMAVIAILVLLATPWFTNQVMESRATNIKNDVKVAEEVVEEYLVKNNDELPVGLGVVDLGSIDSDESIFDTTGVVTTPVLDIFYDITDTEIIDKINTKLGGRFVSNITGKVYYIGDDSVVSTGGTTPEEPVVADGGPIVMDSVYAGYVHSLSLSADGDVYAWGGTFLNSGLVPERVNIPESISNVFTGMYVNYALSDMGNVYAWGYNDDNLIDSSTTDEYTDPQTFNISGENIAHMSAAGSFAFAVTTDGDLYAWGSNNNDGQFGNGTTTSSVAPVLIDVMGKDIKYATAAYSGNGYAISTDGALYGWGANDRGQLGQGNTVPSTTPVLIDIPGETFKKVLSDEPYVMALTDSGDVYSWGYNADGQLGDGTNISKSTPSKVNLGTNVIADISIGAYHTLALTDSGDLYVWGSNYSGAFGDGTMNNSFTPTLVDVDGKTIKSVAGGQTHSLVVTTDGMAYAFGWNHWGQIGDNKNAGNEVLSPVEPIFTVIDDTGGYKFVPSTGMITDYMGAETNLTIPATLQFKSVNYSITSIGEFAFSDNGLTSVVIPGQIENIGDGAFFDNSITSVTLNEGIKYFGTNDNAVNYGVFELNSIDSIHFPDSTVVIGEYCMYDNNPSNVSVPGTYSVTGDESFDSAVVEFR